MEGKVGYMIFGGLGNRMFQVAAIKAYCWDNNKESILLYQCINPHGSGDHANTVFRKIKHEEDLNKAPYFIFDREYLNNIGVSNYLIDKIQSDPSFSNPLQFNMRFESGDHRGYFQIPVTHRNLYLPGYFINEKFFDHHKSRIIDLFAPTKEIVNYLRTKYDKLDNAVAIHIRLPDHIGEYHNAHYDEFYQNAVNEVISKLGDDIHFYIFCNRDVKISQLSFIPKGYYSASLVKEDDVNSLYAISMCKLGCISKHSTFSWWGDYLNTNPDKCSVVSN